LKALLQRVTQASVKVNCEVIGSIGQGLVVLLGVAEGDSEADAATLAERLPTCAFSPMIRVSSISQFQISKVKLLAVSQFTLLADTKRPPPQLYRRCPPNQAEQLYNQFVAMLRATGLKVATGVFRGAHAVEIHNDGPVTLLLDSREKLSGGGC